MDQTQLDRWAASPLCHDHLEDDDPDTGVDDVAHDVREEDGI